MNIEQMTDLAAEYNNGKNGRALDVRDRYIAALLAARDAQYAAMAGQEPVAWPAELSSDQRTQPERFAVIKRDNGDPVIDDDDFKFDALIIVHGDFGGGEKEKYVAEVCRRLNAPAPTNPAAQERAEPVAPPAALENSLSIDRLRIGEDGMPYLDKITMAERDLTNEEIDEEARASKPVAPAQPATNTSEHHAQILDAVRNGRMTFAPGWNTQPSPEPSNPEQAEAPSKLDPNESDPLVLWTEIARLQAAIQGPAGFASWQDAATHERILRVRLERAILPPASAAGDSGAGERGANQIEQHLRNLIGEYWALAHAEGKEGRDHDTEAGDAQRVNGAIDKAINDLRTALATKPQAEQEAAGKVDNIEAAAKTFAERMDYPWDHMPEKGREKMRGHAQAVIDAARASNSGGAA